MAKCCCTTGNSAAWIPHKVLWPWPMGRSKKGSGSISRPWGSAPYGTISFSASHGPDCRNPYICPIIVGNAVQTSGNSLGPISSGHSRCHPPFSTPPICQDPLYQCGHAPKGGVRFQKEQQLEKMAFAVHPALAPGRPDPCLCTALYGTCPGPRGKGDRDLSGQFLQHAGPQPGHVPFGPGRPGTHQGIGTGFAPEPVHQ